jgi:HSP20 family protein
MATEKQKNEKNITTKPARSNRRAVANRSADIFGQQLLPTLWGNMYSDTALWAPAIDVVEKDDKFVAKVELPGVHEEDVDVIIMGDMMIIEGEKQAESEVKKKGYSYTETSYGSFSRSIAIPSIVDIDKISANFDKGVLEIDLPKSVEVKPKKISVTTKKKEKSVIKAEKAAK